jgi:uncharacterized YigZ family protein
MNEKDFYYTISKNVVAEFKERGSRFIAYVYPVQSTHDFKKYLQQLKKEHPKAVHHCFGYRLGFDKNNFRVNDDGEPSGTAGKPILGQIDSKGLTNILVVVVRYFGGTLLGVPGLINAYKTATIMALRSASIVCKAIEVNYRLQFNYTELNDVMILVKKYNCTVIDREEQLFYSLKTGVPLNKLEEFLYKVNELRGVEINKVD